MQWRKSAPADFVFSVKANRYIIHMKKLKEPKDEVSTLLGRVKMLGDRFGPILLGGPPVRQQMDDAAKPFAFSTVQRNFF